MKRGKPARGSPLPRSGPGYSGPAACLSSSLPSKVTYPSYESRDKVLAGLQSTIPSGAGIRGPLHPRRLRCPPSPYHRGYASVGPGRIMPLVRLRSPHRQGSKRFGATADDPPQPWRRRIGAQPLPERCSGDRGAWWENARDLVPARCQFRSTQFTGDIPDSSPGCGRGVSPPTLRGTPAVPFGPGVVHGTVSVLFMNRSV
jgi:hypothetical protein